MPDFLPNRQTRDHVIPISRGGKNTSDNRVWACHRCNLEKANLLPEEYQAVLDYRKNVKKAVPENILKDDSKKALKETKKSIKEILIHKGPFLKHIQWAFAPYVNNIKMAVVSICAAVLLYTRRML